MEKKPTNLIKNNSNESADVSQNCSSKKKRRTNSESTTASCASGEMSAYNKQKIIKVLKETNCSPDLEEMLLLNFTKGGHKTLDDCKEFIVQESLKWQNRITNEYADLQFKSINKTVEYLNRNGVKNECTFDISLILQTIANAETHPSVDELNGIDLKKLYLILANLSRGVPIDDESINEESKNFLLECFAELMEKVQNDENNLIPKLQNFITETKNDNKLKPKIEIVDGINETIDEALMDEITNPLQIPTMYLIEERSNEE